VFGMFGDSQIVDPLGDEAHPLGQGAEGVHGVGVHQGDEDRCQRRRRVCQLSSHGDNSIAAQVLRRQAWEGQDGEEEWGGEGPS
jgi:predicted amidohydrolase